MPVEELDSCDPVKTNADLGLELAFDGITPLKPNAPAYPCGLVAKSLFNDTLALYKVDSYTGIRFENPI